MTLNETLDILKGLKLNGMAESYNEMMNLPINMRPSLERISPIQRPHYITSSYTYQFFEKNIFCIVLRVKDC